MDNMQKLSNMLKNSENIVFFGGAGVSTESGLPDFRSTDGIYYQTYDYPPEEILSHTFFLNKTQEFYEFYKNKMIHMDVLPNSAHHALKELEVMGKLKAVITQNIDGLHQLAKSRVVLELHGSVLRNNCTKCGAEFDLSFIKNSVGIPHCSKCNGIVKPDVVLYEESLNEDVMRQAIHYISTADMLIVGGTSLTVYPAAGLIQYYNGDKMVLINRDSTPMDGQADLVIHEGIGKVMEGAVNGI